MDRLITGTPWWVYLLLAVWLWGAALVTLATAPDDQRETRALLEREGFWPVSAALIVGLLPLAWLLMLAKLLIEGK